MTKSRIQVVAIVFTLMLTHMKNAKAYDLGGPCLSDKEIQAQMKNYDASEYGSSVKAEKAGDWASVVEFRKKSVREDCKIAYRWTELAAALLHVNKAKEAIEVLEEAHKRGQYFSTDSKGIIGHFMSSDEFKQSAFGKLFWSRISKAEDWNIKFRESIRKMPEKLRPPSVYIAKGVCPFECCTYREWSVLKEVDLVDKPMGIKVVARISPGEKVQGLTGEVHVRPVAVGVVFSYAEYEPGNVLFLLNYNGEGDYGYWFNGTAHEGGMTEGVEHCEVPSRGCWLQMVEPMTKGTKRDRSVWWVKVRAKDGAEGWAKSEGQFGDMDACG